MQSIGFQDSWCIFYKFDLMIWYVPQATADENDWIIILIFIPLKNPNNPYYL